MAENNMTDSIPFNREIHFDYGVAAEVAPGVRRLVAPNPGPFTFKGTNTYILGRGEVAVIDPGPDDEAHARALFDALRPEGERITHILLTHTHKDHSAGLTRLAEATGAATLGYGSTALTRQAYVLNPDSAAVIDQDFTPDRVLRDGDRVTGPGWDIEVLHTPGHAPDHLCFALKGTGLLLSGDHVMGWNTTVVAPPEGRMADYLRSLERLLDRDEDTYFPGHGGRVEQPRRLVKAFIVHRRWREAEIVDCLRAGLATIDAIVPRIYAGLASALFDAAAYSVFAHIEFLLEKGRVRCEGPPTLESRYQLVEG